MKLGDWKYYAYLLSSSLDFPVNNRSDFSKTEGANFRLAFFKFPLCKNIFSLRELFPRSSPFTIDIKERKERRREGYYSEGKYLSSYFANKNCSIPFFVSLQTRSFDALSGIKARVPLLSIPAGIPVAFVSPTFVFSFPPSQILQSFQRSSEGKSSRV